MIVVILVFIGFVRLNKSSHVITLKVYFIFSINEISAIVWSVATSCSSPRLTHRSRSLLSESCSCIKLIIKRIALVIKVLILHFTLSWSHCLWSMRIVSSKVHRFICLHAISFRHKIIINCRVILRCEWLFFIWIAFQIVLWNNRLIIQKVPHPLFMKLAVK